MPRQRQRRRRTRLTRAQLKHLQKARTKLDRRIMPMRGTRGYIPRNMGYRPLGTTYTASLKYNEIVSLNPSLGANQSYVFSANDCRDPNVSGTGHQPYGFDQLMTFYNHFTVIGAKCTMRLCSAQQSFPIWAGINLRDTSTTVSSSIGTEYLLEQPGNKMKLIGYGNQGPGSGVNYMVCKFSAKNFFRKSAVIEDANLRGDTVNSPAEQAFFHCVLSPYTNSDDIGLQAFHVSIEYLVVFTEPKILVSS